MILCITPIKYAFYRLFRIKDYKWDYNFFERYAAMLIGIPIVTYIMIEIIGVGKEQVFLRKNIRAAHVNSG